MQILNRLNPVDRSLPIVQELFGELPNTGDNTTLERFYSSSVIEDHIECNHTVLVDMAKSLQQVRAEPGTPPRNITAYQALLDAIRRVAPGGAGVKNAGDRDRTPPRNRPRQ